MVAMNASLADECDFHASVVAESEWRPDLVPTPLVNRYAPHHIDLLSEYVQELARGDNRYLPADVVVAYKWRNGRRPVSMLRFEERALYAAVASVVAKELPERAKERGAYRAFTAAPLQVEGARFVAATDINNYFSSIPLDTLIDLLEARSGKILASRWLYSFLRAISGSHVGIPQVNKASDELADSYGDELERRLLRREIATFRYSDDFRLATPTHRLAVEALDIFDEEARGLGLSMNERKTYIQSFRKYEEKLSGFDHNENSITDEVRDQLTGFDTYRWEPVPPDEAEVARAAAMRMLDQWLDVNLDADAETDYEAGKLAGRALNVLESLEDDSALKSIPNLIRFEPQLTPHIARYLGANIRHHRAAVLEVTLEIIKKRSLSKWQRLWILSIFENSGYIWNAELSDWIKSQANSSQAAALRGYAAWILSINYELNLETWREAASGLDPRYTQYLAAALARCLGVTDKQARSLMPAGYLDRKVYEWVQDDDADDSPF